MVPFNDIVLPEALDTGLSVNGKKQLFQKIAALASKAYGLDTDIVCDALTDRESWGRRASAAASPYPMPRFRDWIICAAWWCCSIPR